MALMAVACGGQILGADGGTSNGDGSTNPTPTSSSKPDGSAPPVYDAGQPPPSQCTPMSGSGSTSSNGDCSVTEDWSCGATKYSVTCTCPAKQCTCSQYTANGGSGTTVPYYNGCGACGITGSQLAQYCGFPSN
ncbi:MAG TPA: hypothetical protein VLM85_04160 [Polyangiaceae bacterium]|nr:hypothetical protein [Polyangiaceae bacterium]